VNTEPFPLPAIALQMRGLGVAFPQGPAVLSGVDLQLHQGRVLALVGESGSGKSLTALALMRLLPQGARRIADQLQIGGHDILAKSAGQMAALRGNVMSIIFQDPSQSLNPTMPIGDQIAEALHAHRALKRGQAREAVLAMLDRVGLYGHDRWQLYPHQLSGGMRQRVLIAMALICQPALLIADEPTAALDAILEGQILKLIRSFCRDSDTAVLLISHDLALMAQWADDIAVMFAGQIVERGPTAQVLDDPQHPYTLTLLQALDPAARAQTAAHPSLIPATTGCRFHRRCPAAIARCTNQPPPMVAFGPTHSAACWRVPLEEALA
jgi:peptide/nickel transport system ATP-binding protein